VLVAYLFRSPRWKHQNAVLAIATIGDWWTWIVISRICEASDDDDNVEYELSMAQQERNFKASPWSTCYQYSMEASMRDKAKVVA
jgi:hypothetical protein